MSAPPPDLPSVPAPARPVVASALSSPGATTPALRRTVFRAARARVLGEEPPPVPAPYGELVARVATSPHRVTDRTVAELRDAGASQDAVLEVVLAAALGGGVVSLERGLDALAALDGGGADPTGGDGRGGA